jgi:hypothetical protein
MLKSFKHTNTFTHDGSEYNLTKLNSIVRDNPIKTFKVEELKWILQYDDPTKDTERMKRARLSVPILVTKWEDKLAVIDGLHRLAKTTSDKIKGRLVSQEQLKKALIDVIH